MRRLILLLSLVIALPTLALSDINTRLSGIRLPEGFHIELWARVPGARSLAVAEELGVVFVGTRASTVFAIIDKDKNLKADEVIRLLRRQKVPNGVAWKDGSLYVAEQHRLSRYQISEVPPNQDPQPQVIFDDFPDKRWHGWRYAAFDERGRLYVAVGAACNICELDGLEGTILRFDLNGASTPGIFATGVRNSVGMDVHPLTKELYFTDNGADWMGDDSPPDELNRASGPGLNFGFPLFGGGDDRTSDFSHLKVPEDLVGPVIEFGAHVAPLGLHFYRGESFPSAYLHDAFVAQHGSWNRSTAVGYRLMRIAFKDNQAQSAEVFAEGWLKSGHAWGRPVDVAELWDGSLLVSDDKADAVYRIFYAPNKAP